MDKLTLASKIATAPSFPHFKRMCDEWVRRYHPQGVPLWALDAFMRAHPLTPDDLKGTNL